MKRTVLLPLVALLTIAAIFAGLHFAQTHPMAARVQQLESELNKVQSDYTKLKLAHDKVLAANATASADAQRSGHVTPVVALAGGETATPATDSSSPAKAGSGSASASGDASAGSSASKRNVVDVPSLRANLRTANNTQIDAVFGRLFKQFGLNDQEQEHFQKLLADRQARQTDVAMKQMDATLTPEQLKAVQKTHNGEIAAIKKDSDAAIRQFLNNDEDYQTFQEWEESRAERSTLQRSVGNFDAAGEPLTSEQRDQLLGVMVSVRKSSTPAQPTGTPKSSSVSPGVAYRARVDASNAEILRQASSFLTPVQLAVLKKDQDYMRSMLGPGTP